MRERAFAYFAILYKKENIPVKVNKIDGQHPIFSSKVRIQPDLIEKFETQGRSTINTFMKKVKKLEYNNNNDVVVISSSTDSLPYKGYPVHRIYMQVFERKGNNVYKTKRPEWGSLSNIGIIDGKLRPFRFNLDTMYAKARENMIKLSTKESKFFRYV